MDGSPPQKFGVGETGNHPKYSLLFARAQSRLKANDVPHATATVFHAQLRNGVRFAASARVSESNRFHRTESQRLTTAPGHLFDGHVAFEVWDGVEVVALILVGGNQRVEKRFVLLAREWAIHIRAFASEIERISSGVRHRLLPITRRPKDNGGINRFACDDGSDRVVERERLDA